SVLSGTNNLVPDQLVGQMQNAIELGDGRRFGLQIRNDVVALIEMVDLVGELPSSPMVDFRGFAASAGDDPTVSVDRLLDRYFVQPGVDDEHHFVLAPVRHPHLLWSQAAPPRWRSRG